MVKRAGRLLDGLDARLSTATDDGPAPDEVCDACIDLLGAEGGYLAVSAPGDVHAAVYAADPRSRGLADLEISLGEGPARSAYAGSAPREASLGQNSSEWPVFAGASAEFGPGTLHAFPVRSPDQVFGVLVVSVATGQDLAVPDEVAQVLVDHAALVLLQSGRTPELVDERAWADQALVHRATGMVVAQLGVSPRSAVAVLRARSFVRDERLVDVARDVVERRLQLGL